MSETFKFRTVEDMHAVPFEKIDHFCHDLALWLQLHKLVEISDTPSLRVTSPRDEFGWVDDGKHDININLKVRTRTRRRQGERPEREK